MSPISRLLSSLLLFSALLSSFLCLAADRLSELSTLTDQCGNRLSLPDLEKEGERMMRETRLALLRLRSKDSIANSLIQGELSLIEAAALYRSVYDDPRSWHHPERSRPGRDDGEAWCREVIEWTVTKVSVDQSPREAEALHRRFEAELQEQLSSHGTLRLAD